MAGLLTAILLGYIGPVTGYLQQRAELRDERAKLAVLEDRREQFNAQLTQLDQPAVQEARARALGLVAPGERPFVVRGNLEPEAVAPQAGGHDGGPLGWLTAIF